MKKTKIPCNPIVAPKGGKPTPPPTPAGLWVKYLKNAQK